MSRKFLYNVVKTVSKHQLQRLFQVPVARRFIGVFFKLPAVTARIGFPLLVPVLYAASSPGQVRVQRSNQTSQLIAASDELFDAAKYKESYEALVSLEGDNDVEVLWRLSRALYKLSQLPNVPTAEVTSLIKQSYEYIEQALALDANNFAVHKWTAIVLGTKTTLEGTKAKIASLPAFRHHIERAIELNPGDPTSIHILGIYFYNIASLAWYEKKIASTLFGKVPDATYQEALSAFSIAEQTSPNFYSVNLLMLGKTYMQLGMIDLAQHWLQQAASYTAKTDEDKGVTKEATELLKKLQKS